MNPRTIIALIGASLLLSMASTAVQAADDRHDYWRQYDEFFELLADGDSETALTNLYKTSPYADEIAADMQNVIFQLNGIGRLVGEYRNHEVLIHRLVADRFAYLLVFVAYDRQPMKMEFQFYRPDEEWFFLNFSFADSMSGDIKDAAQFELADPVR